MLSNISHTVSVGWLDELSYTGNLTTFQQLDFTNGKTASVFLQLHIWQSLLLRQAEAGSRCDSAPLQRCRLLGPDNTGLLWGAWAPQAVESAYLINICKASVWTANYRKSDQMQYLEPLCLYLQWLIWVGILHATFFEFEYLKKKKKKRKHKPSQWPAEGMELKCFYICRKVSSTSYERIKFVTLSSNEKWKKRIHVGQKWEI